MAKGLNGEGVAKGGSNGPPFAIKGEVKGEVKKERGNP